MKLFLCAYVMFSFYAISNVGAESLENVLEHCFPNEEIRVEKLNGGLSASTLYLIKSKDKSYVLRLQYSGFSNAQQIREWYALIESSKKGISPPIHYFSDDRSAILMDFIDQKTISISEANEPSAVMQMADVLRSAHQIVEYPMAGENVLSKAKRTVARVIQDNLGASHEILHAEALIKYYQQQLSTYDYQKVNVHGDLNPRNIFLTPERILLIDWSETTLEDPLYDLSFVALKLDYCKDNEALLLRSYFQREPTQEECERYNLHKKIHQAFWSLTNLYLANAELKKNPAQNVDKSATLKSWSVYQQEYADSTHLPAQFFYELSRLNYQLAKGFINIQERLDALVTPEIIDEYRQNGAVCIRHVFSREEIELLRAGIDNNVKNPTERAKVSSRSDDTGLFFQDFCNWLVFDEYLRFITETPVAAIAGKLVGANTVRFYHDHLLVKEAKTQQRTPWHQDQPYYNIEGHQNCSMWIPVDPVPMKSTLEFIAGSHLGPWLMPRTFLDSQAKWFPEGSLEELPDIEADRSAYPIIRWELEPGDMVCFHMLTLHSAAGSESKRRAFSIRFMGDDIRHAPRPWRTSPQFPGLAEELEGGAPMDHPLFPVLWKSE